MRKIVRKDNSYRKKILSICLVIFAFMGIGYSVISTNLMFNGNIELSKYESPYLYDVLKFETLRGGLARKYTGEHHDSFTEEPSKDIYHWYANNNDDKTAILNKNNVIFANHCWQMVRTTDTGGVKMIYNGEVEDGKCLNTRGNHVGYASRTSQNLASQYWYGTDYTYDSINKVFSLSGATEQAMWSDSTYQELIGKYTCKSTSEDGTCSTLYLIESYYSTSIAYVIPINSNSHYSQFGTLQYNAESSSPAYVGYMYGDVYEYGYAFIASNSYSFDTERNNLIFSSGLSTSYWYADDIVYNSVSGRYSLVNPFQVTSTDDYPNLVGKYTLRNSSATYVNAFVYYIAGVNNTTMYCEYVQDGNLLSAYEPIFLGDSIIDNGDDTYTINNPISVTLSDWYTNYANYNNKYTCNTSGNTCSNPLYIYKTTNTSYEYFDVTEKILIAKSRNGLTLTDTLLVRVDELSNYSDYKYTCNTNSAICTEETLRIFSHYSEHGYNYVSNHYFGSSVIWDGTNYTLVDPIEMENYNNYDNLSSHHYMCISPGLTSCSSVVYMYYINSGRYYYITLNDGVISVSDALEDMLKKNTYNSLIKKGVDAWYHHYLYNYDDYIEDTIFCNSRRISTLNGWDENGTLLNERLSFVSSSRDLSCPNVEDKLSISNNIAKLTYKVGLITYSDSLSYAPYLKTGNKYWIIDPKNFRASFAYGGYLDSIGANNSYVVSDSYGVRPAISLKPGTEYIYGDGSMENPYVVKPVNNCTFNGEMTQGAEYVNGQYTYRYKQGFGNSNWWNIDDDGWGVSVTNKNSIDPVNTRLCTSINNKPIVSMNGMFEDSQATSIDTSSFDTSNVTNMWRMFTGSAATTLDLRSFDTSKVIYMSDMFSDSLATSIDVSSFDTRNVESMNSMFYNTSATSLDLSNFDTRNVIEMNAMFSHSKATSIDVSSFNTSNVVNMTDMFNNSKVPSLDISNFDNTNVVDSSCMFCKVSQDIITIGPKFTFKDEMFRCPS